MHRTICRVIRGTCRKWRDSECPAVSGEEVRKNHNKQNEDFVPDSKYGLTDAVGLTAGIVLAYEITHRRHRLVIEESPSNKFIPGVDQLKSLEKCPFAWPKKAISQPSLSQSVVELNGHRSTATNVHSSKKTSIDLTPFLKDDALLTSDWDGIPNTRRQDDDDIVVQFRKDATYTDTYGSSLQTASSTATDPVESKFARAGKLTGDLLSVLGAFKFMGNDKKPTNQDFTSMTSLSFMDNSLEEPPLTAIELMEKGADLGSSRALYNIGVAYDRMNENQLAGEYYQKAADLGHPLATYNSAVHLLREGRLADGLSLMKVAADIGVPEAKQIISSP